MRRFTLLLLTLATLTTGCATGSNAEFGTGLGAVAGAVTGAAIGKKSGNSATGALLGAGVGALAGSAVGQAVDEDRERSRMIERRIGRRLAGAVTINDVISMTKADLSDEVITGQIRSNGVARRPLTEDVIALKQNGVSDAVIQSLQQTPHPVERVRPVSQPVIVERHYHSAPAVPVFVGPPRRVRHYYHHAPPRRRRTRSSVQLNF